MAKKRKRAKVQGKETTKVKPIKDPNPDCEDYMYDEVDRFHRSKDKILLNPNEEEEEEAELTENLDEEVLALEGASSSDEDDDGEDGGEDDKDGGEDDNEDHGSEVMSSEDEDLLEKGLPSDKAWGHNKKNFYNADVDDDDIFDSGEEAELAADEEEAEAMILQKRLAEQLDTQDFYTFDETATQVEDEVKDSEVAIPKDLSKLSKREKLEILAKESPELLPLLDEYKEKLEEVKEKYHPLMLLARRGFITNPEGIKFIEIKHQLLLNYLVNISFYLALKSSKENTKGHPVIDVLVQHQQLLLQMKPLDEKLEEEMSEFLLKHKHHLKETFTAIKCKDTTEEASQPKTLQDELKERRPKRAKLDVAAEEGEMDPLKYYNLVKAQHEKEKVLRKLKLSDDDEEEENNEEQDEEEGKRMITYEMSKNKGLIRKRRKELKNPRVKHKVKYRKAILKRKGQVREVQHELNRYGGETTGIKSTLTRSTKIR